MTKEEISLEMDEKDKGINTLSDELNKLQTEKHNTEVVLEGLITDLSNLYQNYIIEKGLIEKKIGGQKTAVKCYNIE